MSFPCALQWQKGQTEASAFEESSISTVLEVLTVHTTNEGLSEAAATTLSALSTNAQNCESIVKLGGIRAVMAAFSKNPENAKLFQVGCCLC